MSWFSRIKHFDIQLLLASSLLLLIGLVLQYAISVSGNTMEIFYRQLVFALIGVLAFIFFAYYDYRRLAKINRWVYVALILSLVYLLLFGGLIRGTTGWIELGFFNLQPAELAKIIIILGLARWLYLRRGEINSWKNFLIVLLYVAIPAGLIFLEPDLGSTIVLVAIWFGVVLISPLRKMYLIILMIFALIFAGISWQFILKDYQKDRVEVFLHPDKDPRGKGYNVRQATIAVGSGQLLGRGLGKGLQSQLKFLPERQTDFIFASSAEEIGFLGMSVVIGLFFWIFFRLVKIMKFARDDLAMYIVAGIFFYFFFQVTANIGINLGLLPVTGIPLLLISYGGSSLLVTCIALGVAQNIARQSKTLRF